MVVIGAQADELRVGDRHAPALEGEVDRSLLDHTVDVVPPGVTVEQAVDRQLQLVVEPPQ